MTARFNHLMIPAHAPTASAAFYRSLIEAEDAPSWGPFVNLLLTDGVLLQFATPPTAFDSMHFAFLVDDEHFDRARASLEASATDYWADPHRTKLNEIGTEDDARALYVVDPNRHLVELLTKPYV